MNTERPEGKDGAESMHGWRFDEPLESVIIGIGRTYDLKNVQYLIERCRRTESDLTRLREELKVAQTMIENAALEPEAKPMTVEELREMEQRIGAALILVDMLQIPPSDKGELRDVLKDCKPQTVFSAAQVELIFERWYREHHGHFDSQHFAACRQGFLACARLLGRV